MRVRSYTNYIGAHTESVAHAAQTRVWRESCMSAIGKRQLSDHIDSTTAWLAPDAAMRERERSERSSTNHSYAITA